MNCNNHPQSEAQGMCTYCGKPFCAECLVEVKGKMYCKNDLGNVLDEAKEKSSTAPMVFMNAGGGAASSSSSSSSSSGGSRIVPPYPKNSVGIHILLLLFTAGVGNVIYFLYIRSKQKQWEQSYSNR